MLELLKVLTTRALGIAGVGTHGGRRARMLRSARRARVGRARCACVADSTGGRRARPGVQLLARGVAVEASASGPRRRAWRTERLRTCESYIFVYLYSSMYNIILTSTCSNL